MSLFWATFVLLTPEAEPAPLGRPHPVSYPVSYFLLSTGRAGPAGLQLHRAGPGRAEISQVVNGPSRAETTLGRAGPGRKTSARAEL